MAQKLLKKSAKKIAPKKTQEKAETGAVLVGTYKEKQLAWIKKNHVYNYPVKDGDEFDAKAFAAIRELWLYADVKGTRHAFEAEFVGKMTKDEFLAANPTYAKLGQRRIRRGAVLPVLLVQPHERGLDELAVVLDPVLAPAPAFKPGDDLRVKRSRILRLVH